jgi:ketosteroid isomerase-like protein
MFRRLRPAFVLASLVVLGACHGPRCERCHEHASEDVPPEIARVLADYERAWEAGDEDALAALFAVDEYVLSNQAAPVRGRDAIRAAYEDASGPLALTALHAEIDERLAYVVGVYAAERGAPPRGKFVLVLERARHGQWLIAADIDNAVPAPRGREV